MSPSEPIRVLLIEDDAEYLSLLRELVEGGTTAHFRVAGMAGDLAGGIERMRAGGIDVVLLDLNLPDSRELQTFIHVRSAAPALPVIILSGIDDEEFAAEAVHLGAQDYLVKSRTDAHLLQRALRYAVERSRSETQFSRERDLLNTLLDNIPDRIYFKDRESRFIRINRALMRLFGLERPEDAYGRTDADFYGGDHAQDALADERQVMATGEPVLNKVESETLHDGTRAWSLTTKLPLRDRTGAIVGTCGISREITDLKEMEATLENERNLLRAVIDNVPDHIFLKDAEGHYLLDNVAHMRWLGASDPSEVVGRTPFDFFPDETARAFAEADRPVLLSGQPEVNHEEKTIDAQGNTHWALLTKVPWLSEDGRVHGLVCLKRDITEQKRAEARLMQANEKLAANREELLMAMGKLQAAHQELRDVQLQLIDAEKMKSIGRLAAGVAHEVKNPLAIVRMGLEFLSQSASSDEHTTLILKEMSDAVQRADDVVRGLLDFSAPKKLDVKHEDINAIIDQALKLVRGEMKPGVEIIRELQPRLPALALDAAKMSQVFVNLFINALHAIGEKGTLTVRTYSKQLTGVGANISGTRSESFRVGSNIVVVEIDDTGHGIPEDKLAKIFEPFFTTKPTGIGTGLGLSVVKTIVDLHGATIDVRNLHESGARVTIMFQV
ncbi:MAG: PAS domain-containing protein [Chthoniobacteraceae bacterium]